MSDEKPFPEEPRWDPLADPVMDRRSFLKASGFFLGAGLLSACGRSPALKALPQLASPEELVPGRALWYATTCGGCPAGCGALVKVRDGRPIKLEGNPAHPLSLGGLCAVGQASVLELYDSRRLTSPLLAGKPVSWEEADARVLSALKETRVQKRAVRVLTGTVHSPSLRRAISRLLGALPDAKHVAYDALSCSAVVRAHELSHGRKALPRYRLDKARVLVGIDADFLGAWFSPVEHAALWRAGRVPSGTPPRMSYHVQFEARMSLTGANADRRVLLKPGDEGLLAAHLALALSRRAGLPAPYASLAPCPVDPKALDALVGRLWAARGQSLILCGVNELEAQLAVNCANAALGAYGKTLDIGRPSLQRRGDDATLAGLLSELAAGKVGVLLVHGCNPAAELPANGLPWEQALGKAGLVVATSPHLEETSRSAGVVAPDHHFLESWLDSNPAAGVAGVVQPAVRPLGGTRSILESLAAWTGRPESALEQVRAAWRESGLAHPERGASFEESWARVVQDGFARPDAADLGQGSFKPGAARARASRGAPEGPALLLYPKIAVLEGRHAQNPWLQELPDPVSKVVWDNYASLSPADARRAGLAEGDLVRVASPEGALDLPVLIQPGQRDETVCVALGYGRAGTERFSELGPDWISGKKTVPPGGRVGRNASGLLSLREGLLSYRAGPVRLEKLGGKHPLARSQAYDSLEVPARLAEKPGERRDAVRETTLAAYAASPSAGNPSAHPAASLWPRSLAEGARRWAMAVDLNLCTGCSACVVACQAENNVPSVGKDEVGRRRDMAWLRVDRYYAESEDGVRALHQPMLCQHCAHAPCETVCPVVAIAGSEDGLNQQVYNRCVGTRYCANNCPYKVRRFNWFQYRAEGEPESLVLNPDVTIRSRGVMEKCSFCVQRIQEAKIEAKRRGESLADGAVRTACQQSCPTQAIVFGDAEDKTSAVAARMQDPRRYRVLEELHVDPAVGYLTKVSHRAA